MANEQHLHPAVKKRMAREHAKAVKTAEEAVASARASYGEEHPQVAVALANLGKLHQGHSEFAQAETALTQALVIREKRPSDAAGLAGSLRDLARLHHAAGQGEKARPLMPRLRARARRKKSDRRPGRGRLRCRRTESDPRGIRK